MILERLDLVADGGRGHVKFSRRLFDAQVTGNCFERSKRVQWGQSGRHFRIDIDYLYREIIIYQVLQCNKSTLYESILTLKLIEIYRKVPTGLALVGLSGKETEHEKS